MHIQAADCILHNIRHSPTQSSTVGPPGDSGGSNTSRQRKGPIKVWVMREMVAHGNRGRQTGYSFQAGSRKSFDRVRHDFPLFEVLQVYRSPSNLFSVWNNATSISTLNSWERRCENQGGSQVSSLLNNRFSW